MKTLILILAYSLIFLASSGIFTVWLLPIVMTLLALHVNRYESPEDVPKLILWFGIIPMQIGLAVRYCIL